MTHQFAPEEAWREGDDRDYFGYGEDEGEGDRGYAPVVTPAAPTPSGLPAGIAAPTQKLPAYDDPAFFERQNQQVIDPASHCARHGRSLSRTEWEQKTCFWCKPEAYERYLRRRLDLNPPPHFKDPKKKTSAERRQEKAHAEAAAAVKNMASILKAIEDINTQLDWQEQQEGIHVG